MEQQPTFHWQDRAPWLRYVLATYSCVVVFALWEVSRTEGDRSWLSRIGVFLYAFIPDIWLSATLYCLTDRALLIVHRFARPTWIPLATTELLDKGGKKVLRWRDGRRRPTVTLPRSLAPTMQAALDQAPTGGPATEREAAQSFPMAVPLIEQRQVWAMIGGALVLFGLAVWLNQPLFLLPLAAIPVLIKRYTDDYVLVLTPTDLWLAARKAQAVRVPRSAITGVAPARDGAVTIFTTFPELPQIRVNEYQSGHLLRALRRTEASEPPKTEATTEGPTPAVEVRCSLCGRPLPGVALPGEVHICDRCGGKARHQAIEAGHGPAGKEPKPM